MMNYVGNFSNWIDAAWFEEVLANRGIGRPGEGKKPNSPEEKLEYQKAIAGGYDPASIYFYMFDKNSVSFTLPRPPFVEGNFHWWITKMLPGQFMPMHIDPHTNYEKNSRRFWMPWQDYQGGHIFAYEDQIVANYKAGDVYEYSNSKALHGAANVGLSSRIVLQVSTYE